MLKLLMTSAAYRQTSQGNVARGAWRLARKDERITRHAPRATRHDPEKVDPANRLLWRMRLRRLDAEVIRDSLLGVSGRLDRAMGGPPVLLKSLPDGRVVVDERALATPTAGNRRSVYLLFRRAYNLSLLSAFDQPAVAVNCTRRDTSAVPLQALTMLNDPLVAELAEHFARRVRRLAGDERDRAIQTAFRLALARRPSAAEADICARLLERQERLFRSQKLSAGEAEHRAVVQLCHTLLNTSEFLYVE
jgi:hypothetical protein